MFYRNKSFQVVMALVLVIIVYQTNKNSRLKTAEEQKSYLLEACNKSLPKFLEQHPTPTSFGDITFEPATFYAKHSDNSDETIARNGILTLRKNPKGNVLVCHGYMCDKIDVSFLRTFFANYNILQFDFRAHGEKTAHEYCTFGKNEIYDVMAATNFLKTHPKTKDLRTFGYGFSMGAASLIEAQAREKLFEALILDCPFDTSKNIVRQGLSHLQFDIFGYKFSLPGTRLLEEYAFHPYVQPLLKLVLKAVAKMDSTKTNTQLYVVEPMESIKNIDIPCFFIHCKNDEKIPIDSIKNIFNNASCFKRLWISDGRKHCDSIFFHPEKYIHLTNNFLDEILTDNIKNTKTGEILED